ncbi:MAG: DUF4238 domain-containing protein [Gemmatimonadetes bacterium]|nr:DUF4238 domain-containing protein [Gemmatimonadota bacterium]
METTQSKKHHYIPRMLLKNFKDDNGMLQVFDRTTGKFRKNSDLFFKKYLNTQYGDGGRRDNWDAEERLSRIESDAEPAILKIIEAVKMNRFPKLSPEHRTACKRFFIHMVLRNPQHAQQILRAMRVDDAIYEACRRLLNNQGIPVPDKHMFDSGPRWIELKKKILHNNRARFAAGLPSQLGGEIERYIGNYGVLFGVLREPQVKFVIGDCAVIRNSAMDDNPFEWLPIAPDVAISIRGTPDKEYSLQLESEEVDRVNASSFAQSSVIAAQNKSDLERVIRHLDSEII